MWRILLPSVVVPLIAVIVMTIMEAAARPAPLWEKMCDIGWDLCILGVGVTGGIFAHSEMKAIYKDDVLLWAVIAILINIGLASVILLLRRHYSPAGPWIGRASVFLGIIAVGLPSGMTFWR